MDKEEHLSKLREGVGAWNKFRRAQKLAHPILIRADLRRENLRGVMLVGADLGSADLRDADLRGADLRGANLNSANFRGANLSRADLSHANLRGAILHNADLRGVNLSRADLSGANLNHTTLSRANLNDATLVAAKLNETVFGDTNLTGAKGLENCEHFGPSILDHRTFERSGTLPLNFLRGCGLPDTLIDYLPSLLNQPIQFYSCFISYSSKDDDFAKRIHADLQAAGARCWFAPEDLKIGDQLHDTIDTAIRRRDKLMLLLSETSVTSGWVEREVRTALDSESKKKRPVLFPLRLDEAVMNTTDQWAHDIRRNRHIGDFTNWKNHDAYQEAFQRLLRDLKVEKGNEE